MLPALFHGAGHLGKRLHSHSRARLTPGSCTQVVGQAWSYAPHRSLPLSTLPLVWPFLAGQQAQLVTPKDVTIKMEQNKNKQKNPNSFPIRSVALLEYIFKRERERKRDFPVVSKTGGSRAQ